jgi:hypothetical protein
MVPRHCGGDITVWQALSYKNSAAIMSPCHGGVTSVVFRLIVVDELCLLALLRLAFYVVLICSSRTFLLPIAPQKVECLT